MSINADRAYLIVPFLNEAAALPDMLESIARQSIEPERLFLVAVDSGSTDNGAAIISAFIDQGPIEGVVLRSTVRSIPAALNTGFRWVGAKGIAIRLDAHTVYDPLYLPTILDAFETGPPTVWCVGGAQTPEVATDFGRALVVGFMSNPVGLGFSPHRVARTPRLVDNVYLGAFRAGVVPRIGFFDERWRANEDSELMARVIEAGGQILWIPIKSFYRVKRGPMATLRQWARYGFWRAQTIKRHPARLGLRHCVPPIALVVGLALLSSPWRAVLTPFICAYAVAIVWLRPPGQRPVVTAASVLYFPAAHSLNAAGLIIGLLLPVPKYKNA